MAVDGPAPGVLEVAVTHDYGATVLSVRGHVDLTTVALLRESIDTVVLEHAPSSLIVDLTDVGFLASVGMSVLLELASRVGESTRFAVVADGPTTRRPLTILGIDQQIALYTDLSAACAALAV